VDELGAEAIVGEMALLTGQSRAATVGALNDAELVRFSRAGFERLVEQHHQMMQALAQSILPRLHRVLFFPRRDQPRSRMLQLQMEPYRMHRRSGLAGEVRESPAVGAVPPLARRTRTKQEMAHGLALVHQGQHKRIGHRRSTRRSRNTFALLDGNRNIRQFQRFTYRFHNRR
jgi:CRP-like cAMP-binding protein